MLLCSIFSCVCLVCFSITATSILANKSDLGECIKINVPINAALRSDLLVRSPVLDGGATFSFNF